MNGRIYDPLIGRMLSADVVVQAPGNLQSFNRYSYVMNNPLTLTDPSGFLWQWLETTLAVGHAIVTNPVGFVGGVAGGWAEANDPTVLTTAGMTGTIGPGLDSANLSTAAQAGRVVGNLAAMVQGAQEIVAGGTIATGGSLATVTGVGAPPGVLAVAGGGALAAHGAAVGLRGGNLALQNLRKLDTSDVEPTETQGQVDPDKAPNDSATHPLDPDATPHPDVTEKTYEKGTPDQIVVDHIHNRASGGHPTDPANLDPKSIEANSRKAGFEGNLAKDRQKMIDAGMDPKDVDAALAPEKKWIETDIHPVPVDPEKLKNLPQQ